MVTKPLIKPVIKKKKISSTSKVAVAKPVSTPKPTAARPFVNGMPPVAKKVSPGYRPQVRSRHPSHSVLRTQLPKLPFKSIIRMGSTTELDERGTNAPRVECNSVEAIRNSSNKLLMKQCFTKAGVMTAAWCRHTDTEQLASFGYPIVAKAHFGSRGDGNTLIKTEEEFTAWKRGKTLGNYIFEKFYNYGLEFRFHVTEDGYFYACRKALKADAPESEKWRRHDDICVWLMENNPEFKKPGSWDDIISDCVKALKAVGADVLSFDVKVQGPTVEGKKRDYQDYILIECNSASSFGDVTAEKYIAEIPKILTRKWNNLKK